MALGIPSCRLHRCWYLTGTSVQSTQADSAMPTNPSKHTWPSQHGQHCAYLVVLRVRPGLLKHIPVRPTRVRAVAACAPVQPVRDAQVRPRQHGVLEALLQQPSLAEPEGVRLDSTKEVCMCATKWSSACRKSFHQFCELGIRVLTAAALGRVRTEQQDNHASSCKSS